MGNAVTKPPTETADGVVLDPDNPTVRQLVQLVESIPGAEGDAYERIIAQVLTAGTSDALDAPWTALDGLRDYCNRTITVHNVRKAPSSFDKGLEFFLILDCSADDGERFLVSTGSVSIVAQVARAHAIGALPWRCIPRQSATPSARGFYPMHLESARS